MNEIAHNTGTSTHHASGYSLGVERLSTKQGATMNGSWSSAKRTGGRVSQSIRIYAHWERTSKGAFAGAPRGSLEPPGEWMEIKYIMMTWQDGMNEYVNTKENGRMVIRDWGKMENGMPGCWPKRLTSCALSRSCKSSFNLLFDRFPGQVWKEKSDCQRRSTWYGRTVNK